MLWALPVSVSRFEYVPNQYCRADEEWSVPEEFSHEIWKKVRIGQGKGGFLERRWGEFFVLFFFTGKGWRCLELTFEH